MKKRLLIATTIFLVLVATFSILSVTLKTTIRPIFLFSFFIATFYLVIYFIGGISKLFVYLIYGVAIFLLIYFFNSYRFAFMIIGTFIIVMNPLAYIENRLAPLIDSPEPFELQMLVTRSYFPYYDYRAKMKEYYHLPQARKYKNERRYYILVTATTIVLSLIGILLSLLELNAMTEDLANFRLESILVFYIVVVIFGSAVILNKKGFNSLRHFITPFIFVPMALLVLMTELPIAWKISISAMAALLTLITLGYEIILYYKRVAYHSSVYIDSNTNHLVHANLLYEPYMFNEFYTLVGKYEINTNEISFQKYFEQVLVYANYKKFFISAFVETGSSIILYTQFHKNNKNDAIKFSNFLEKTFETSVLSQISDDPSHAIYENTFYRSDDYIVARAVSLGALMKEMEITDPLIISMYFYFKNLDLLKDFNDLYKVDIVAVEYDLVMIKVEFEIVNVEYLIDIKVREILLNALINDGTYVRITAAMKGELHAN